MKLNSTRWQSSVSGSAFLRLTRSVRLPTRSLLAPYLTTGHVLRKRVIRSISTMSISNDAGHFFQTSDSIATTERKAAKSKNKHGNPLKLQSKILAVHPDGDNAVYVAEAAGDVRRIVVEVCKTDEIEHPLCKGYRKTDLNVRRMRNPDYRSRLQRP